MIRGAMRPSLSAFLRRFGWLAPTLVLAAVWAPIWAHYRIPTLSLSPELVERARAVPEDSVLAELQGARFSGRRWAELPDLLPIAERLLRGEATVPGYATARVRLPFDPGDLDKGLPGWQLELASLVVPEILLAAYEASGREEFFLTARDAIRGWATYERRTLVPRAFLWNDHALTSRVVVLAHFWRLYRRHPSYDPAVARSVLEFALRSGYLLAAPAQFTPATNHGVMQNLALWHIAVAFPLMPQRESMRQIAFDRLEGQMRYYVDSHGVVLEHSAGYQAFGVELLGMALRYLTLMGEAAPPDWIRKYEAAKEVYRIMRRPDGTLPLLGDTGSQLEPIVPLVTTVDASGRAAPLERRDDWSPGEGNRLFADAGYAIWWDGREDRTMKDRHQTLVTWSYFPGHGHKHADELSVLLWADGRSWWTNVGYWTYGLPGRAEAESWPGSNAPHLAGEPAQSVRESRLLGSGESGRVSAVDLERRGPGAYRARRQVLHLRPDLWLVLDQTQGGEQDRTTTTWTTSPDVTLVPGSSPGTYLLTTEGAPSELRAALASSHGTAAQLLHRSFRPFAGWVVHHGVPTATTSIVLEQAARDSWTVAVWRLAQGAAVLPSAGMGREGALRVNYRGPEDWEVTLSPWLGAASIRREGGTVSVRTVPAREAVEATTFAPVPRDSSEIQSIEQGLLRMASAYPRFRDYLPQRFRISGWLVAGLLIQEVIFLALRHRRAEIELPLRAVSLAGWVTGGLWLVGVYLRT
jgi:sarcosine oxidase gamma subunit